VEESQRDRDAHFKEVVHLSEQLSEAVNEKDLLKKRTRGVGKGSGKADTLLRKFGLDKNKDYSDVPPKVEGVVTATRGPAWSRFHRLRSGAAEGHRLGGLPHQRWAEHLRRPHRGSQHGSRQGGLQRLIRSSKTAT